MHHESVWATWRRRPRRVRRRPVQTVTAGVAALAIAAATLVSASASASASASGAQAAPVAYAAPATHAAPAGASSPAQRCAALAELRLPQVTVTSVVADTDGSFTVPDGQGGHGEDLPGTVYTGLPAFCDVALTRTNPPSHHEVHLEVWLPLTTWNSRFQGVGGGGFVAGISYRALVAALRGGYATASTDTGHPASQEDGSFVLRQDGTLDQAAITDFAYRAVHEMTVAGKEVTTRFYGSAAHHAYFTGCSMGGRQGLTEAQRYPHDYDGIVAGAPAVNFPRLSAAQLWPQFVMLRTGDFIPRCKFQAFQSAVTARCDGLDGVTDGVLGNPAACRFDPRSMVGTATPCGTITRTDAAVVEQIWRGPRQRTGEGSHFLWYGPEPGTILSYLAASDGSAGSPLYIAESWFRYWLTQDPSFDWTTLTTDTYERLFAHGVDTFGVLASHDPDLRAFRAAGGKLVIWAGLADPVIPPQGSVRYYDDVVRHSGGQHATGTYARLFLAPGAGHCGATPGTIGPVPADPLGSLTSWVEHGVPPQSIEATRTDGGTVLQSRPVCVYPLIARYDGHGSTDDAANFYCARQ